MKSPSDEPRTGPCPPALWAALTAQASAIFRPGAPEQQMRRDYPLLFARGNRHRLIVRSRNGHILAHAGYCLREAVWEPTVSVSDRQTAAPAPLPDEGRSRFGSLGPDPALPMGSRGAERRKAALIGGVFTTPAARGQGHASAVLGAALARARAEGATFAVISGWRGLYRRAGATRLPAQTLWHVPPGWGSSGPAMDARPATPADLEHLQRLRAAESPRFARSGPQWRQVLSAGMVHHRAGRVLLVEAGGNPRGYVAVQEPLAQAQGPSALILEAAGDRLLLVHALPAMAQALGCSLQALGWLGAPHDTALAKAAEGAGLLASAHHCHHSVIDWGSHRRPTQPWPIYGLDYV